MNTGGIILKGKLEIIEEKPVPVNNRCRYQSITQQYLKRCLIKDEVNYMFRPIAAIIRFSSESMVVVLYRIGMLLYLALPPYFRMKT